MENDIPKNFTIPVEPKQYSYNKRYSYKRGQIIDQTKLLTEGSTHTKPSLMKNEQTSKDGLNHSDKAQRDFSTFSQYRSLQSQHQKQNRRRSRYSSRKTLSQSIEIIPDQKSNFQNDPLTQVHETGESDPLIPLERDVVLPISCLSQSEIQSEVNRLALLYSPVTIQEQSNDDSLNQLFIHLILHPSDPDFNGSSLLPNGLDIRLRYFYKCVDETSTTKLATEVLNSQGDDIQLVDAQLIHTSTVEETDGQPPLPNGNTTIIAKCPPILWSSIDILNAKMPKIVIETLQAVYEEALTRTKSPYQSFKYVDRALNQVFYFAKQTASHELREYCKQFGAVEWTTEEQQKLEDALIWYGRVIDPKAKWSKIAAFVGHGRTAKECAERFKECRDSIKQKRQVEISDQHEGSPRKEKICDGDIDFGDKMKEVTVPIQEDIDMDAAKDPPSGLSMPGRETIVLQNFKLENIGLVQLALLRMLVNCTRCSVSNEIILSTPLPSHSNNDCESQYKIVPVNTAIESKTNCTKCNSMMQLQYLPQLAFQSHGQIAEFYCPGGHLVDVLPSSYFIECSECLTTLLCRDVFSAVERRLRCRFCHSELRLFFDAILISGSAVERSQPHVKQHIKKRLKDPYIYKIGTPLPADGTCRHYKKSYRWLRFPCCGRAFPCDICHDEQSDHPSEWATRMICGYCSKEQSYSQKPCICGSSLTATFSSHWENCTVVQNVVALTQGGRGCRDPSKMSKKDDKKYKMLKKATKSALPRK